MDKFSVINMAPKDSNYFFGFHDLVAWNKAGDKLAALQIDDILTPPHPEKTCNVGFIQKSVFTKLGTTYAYNYPQGARQQWIGDTNLLLVNDKIEGKWRSKVYDTDSLSQISSLEFPSHIVTNDGWAFGLDYARLHRLGGYGYTGLADETAAISAPKDSGIVKHNVYTKVSSLLVSIEKVASFEIGYTDEQHHYLTHLVLNPSQSRIAFLHRYKLKDGGETTRLMTIGINGEDLRCLSAGALSHFDWTDDDSLIIWGRVGSNVERLRNSIFYKLLPKEFFFHGKKIVKAILGKNKRDTGTTRSFNWMLFNDSSEPGQKIFAKDIMTEDGHPMFCPANRDWLVCDTYPDSSGTRQLYLYKRSANTRVELGEYKMIDDKPDIVNSSITLKDVDPNVLKAFSIEKMAFYRSGLHCDLHPRWKGDGSVVCFDSIHEGKRSIYGINVANILDS